MMVSHPHYKLVTTSCSKETNRSFSTQLCYSSSTLRLGSCVSWRQSGIEGPQSGLSIRYTNLTNRAVGNSAVAWQVNALRAAKVTAEARRKAAEANVIAVEQEADRAKLLMSQQLAVLEEEVLRTMAEKDAELAQCQLQLAAAQHNGLQEPPAGSMASRGNRQPEVAALQRKVAELRRQNSELLHQLQPANSAASSVVEVQPRLIASPDASPTSGSTPTDTWSPSHAGSPTSGSVPSNSRCSTWERVQQSLTSWQRVHVVAEMQRRSAT